MRAVRLPCTAAIDTIAGLGYGVLAVAARVLPGFSPHQLIRDPAAYALAAAGIVSFMLYATALEGGSVTVATAAVVLAETTAPAVVGVMFLGDHARPGLGGVALLGFSLAIVCAVALARFGEADEEGGLAQGTEGQQQHRQRPHRVRLPPPRCHQPLEREDRPRAC